MKKLKVYKYYSDNGVVVTSIDLEIGNPIISFRLIADTDKILTNGEKREEVVEVPEEEISNWQEVEKTEEEKEEENTPFFPPQEEPVNYKELLEIITGVEE